MKQAWQRSRCQGFLPSTCSCSSQARRALGPIRCCEAVSSARGGDREDRCPRSYPTASWPPLAARRSSSPRASSSAGAPASRRGGSRAQLQDAGAKLGRPGATCVGLRTTDAALRFQPLQPIRPCSCGPRPEVTGGSHGERWKRWRWRWRR